MYILILVFTVIVLIFIFGVNQKNEAMINHFQIRLLDNDTNNDANNSNNMDNDTSVLPITIHPFHDYFARLHDMDNNRFLGWRYWFMKHKSKFLVKPDTNFVDVPTNYYLKHLESLTWLPDCATRHKFLE